MARQLLSNAFLLGLMSCLSGNAFAMQERITLMFSGSSCAEHREAIEHALSQVSGVRHIDLRNVPDHILVDIETGTVSAEVLQDRGNDALESHGSCRTEIMKSCISTVSRSASMRTP